MLRRSLFFGLTLVLVVALVTLIIRSRNLEKKKTEQPPDFLQETGSTPIRVFAPDDLELTEATMHFEDNGTARHEFTIRNKGSVTYKRIQLEMVYLDSAGKELMVRTRSVDRTISPGESLAIDEIEKKVPGTAAKLRARIVYAEMKVG